MTAQILDGKKTAKEIRQELDGRVRALIERGVTPRLVVILVGEDPASHVYVGQKIKKCGEVGIESIHRPLPANVTIIGGTTTDNSGCGALCGFNTTPGGAFFRSVFGGAVTFSFTAPVE